MASPGGEIYVLGGLSPSGSSTGTIMRVSGASSDVVTGSLAQPAHDAAGAMLSGEFFVFGGGETNTIDTVQRIRIGSPGAMARVVGRLPRPRSDLSAVVVGGNEAIIAGGFDGHRLLPDVLETSDGVRFRTIAALKKPLRYIAAAAAGTSVFLFGGTDGSQESDAIQRIDTSTGVATIVGHLPHPLGHASALLLKGKIYVLGGRKKGLPTDEVLSFDPGSFQIAKAGRLPYAVSDAAAVTTGEHAIVIGGEIGARHEPTARVIELVVAS